MKTTPMNDDTATLVKVLRDMANTIERRGVVEGSIMGSGENEVIELPRDAANGYVKYRPGPKCHRSFSWSWADVEPVKDGEISNNPQKVAVPR